jgi:hypothetical protein
MKEFAVEVTVNEFAMQMMGELVSQFECIHHNSYNKIAVRCK